MIEGVAKVKTYQDSAVLGGTARTRGAGGSKDVSATNG